MKKRIISALAVCVCLAVLSVPVILKADDDNAFRINGEKRANAMEDEASDTVVFSTDDIEVTRGDLMLLFLGNKGTGKSKNEVIESSVQTVVTRKQLYDQAVKAGLEISDSEYETYKDMLEESLQKAENKEDIEAYFDGFGGKDNYWTMMKPTIMQNLLVRKYLNMQTGNESDIVGYSAEESQAEAAEQQEAELQIKTKAYEDALSDDEKAELMDVAAELYKEFE